MNFLDFINRKKDDAPRWIQDYLKMKFKFPHETPLSAITFCSLDCETTGFEKDSDVISIGAVRLENRSIAIGNVLDLRFSVSKGQKQSEIHEELAQDTTRDEEAQLKTLLDYIGNSVIVGHHVTFDITKINQMIARYHKGFALKNKSVDTFLLMRRIDPLRFERNVGALQSMKLDALCSEFNIDVENRHTALGDAYLAAQLFIKQLHALKKRKVVTVGDL